MSESSFPQMKTLDSFISKSSLASELNNTMSFYLETVVSIMERIYVLPYTLLFHFGEM